MLEDAVVRRARLGHPERADLAEPDAVSPPLSGEDEHPHGARGIALAVHDEQVLAQPQAPADAEPAQDEIPVAAGNRELDDAAGDAESPRRHVAHGAHAAVARDRLRE